MITTLLPLCDCCGLPVSTQEQENCPRCGYPTNVSKEEQFLEISLRDLQRTATYGGANMTVTDLIQRYQSRLNYLRQLKAVSVPVASMRAEQKAIPVQPFMSAAQSSANGKGTEQAAVPSPFARPESMEGAPAGSVRPAAKPAFSWKTFFEDQTINIVASLGAFLILVGSLSFIATTSSLLLSFLVLFAVHAVFGVTGVVSYRFRSFRTVAIIYTAIFALLVPLVGFSGYRLAVGHIIQLSTPTLVTIAATYAAIIYGGLAVYQKFSPFGYLAVAALTIADLALTLAFQPGPWWWPSTLMLLALPALLSVPRRSGSVWPFTSDVEVLRTPVRVLMFACIAVCGLGALGTFLYSFGIDNSGHPLSEVRFSIFSMTLLLLCWACLYVWLTMQADWIQSIPSLFLSCVLACSYALNFHQSGYVLALTAVAFLYHGLNRFVPQLLQPFGKLGKQIEVLALVLVGLVPFIALPLSPLELFAKAYTPNLVEFHATGEVVAGLLTVVAGLGLTLSVVFSHTILRKTLDALSARWCWLLLLSGFLLNWFYSTVVLLLNADPVWCLLGLTLALVAAAVVVRRLVGAAWANPLDVLVLIGIVQTLSLSLAQSQDTISALLLFFAVLSYGVLLYQHRHRWLFLSLVFSVLAFPFLLQRTAVMLLIGVLLPLASVIAHHLTTNKWNATHGSARPKRVVAWEWPLLVVSLFYGGIVSLYDLFVPTSAVQNWLHIGFPVALEMSVLSLVWYASAALARVKWWLFASVGFAVAALLIPTNQFWVLAWLAPILAILAFGINRLAGRDWALPLSITAVLAAVMMGVAGSYQGQLAVATWVLLGFALLIYLVGVAESHPLQTLFLCIAPFFAIWSVFDAALLGDLYRPPVVALICATIGVGISSLRSSIPMFFSPQKGKFLRFALPFYATALAAAVLTGVYGTLAGVNHPFYAAIPTALLVYALVAYGVLLFERQPNWLWLVVGFGLWGTLLAVQTTSCLGLDTLTIAACSVQVQTTAYYLTAVALVTGISGVLAGRLVKYTSLSNAPSALKQVQASFAWSWAWYLISLIAIFVTVSWNYSVGTKLLPETIEYGCLFAFIGLTLLVILVERAPELLVLPVALAVWILSLPQWELWQVMISYSLLCILVFTSRFMWKLVPSATNLLPPIRLHDILGLGGQVFVVLAIIVQGGLFAEAGWLAHVGAGSLFVLGGLVFCYGRLQAMKSVQRWCDYGAGLLLSLVVSWELSAFGQARIDVLWLAPATYLIVVAPFLSRDEAMLQHHRVGQICSILGSALLLLPTLWLSFNQDNLLPTLVLAGESLALLLLGLGTRVRVFILSGAGLLIVSAMHALFLPSLGIPSSLALAILGGTLLAVATTLSLARRRLQGVWIQWK